MAGQELTAEKAARVLQSIGVTQLDHYTYVLCGFSNVGVDALASLGASSGDTSNVYQSFDGTHTLDKTVHGISMDATTTTLAPDKLFKQEGHERGMELVRAAFRDCEGCMYVYDVANRASFDSIARLHSNMDAELQVTTGKTSRSSKIIKPMIVIANKIDLPEAEWQVSHEEGRRWAESIGAKLMPASAKTGEGVMDCILSMASQAVITRARVHLENETFLASLLSDVPKAPTGIRPPPGRQHPRQTGTQRPEQKPVTRRDERQKNPVLYGTASGTPQEPPKKALKHGDESSGKSRSWMSKLSAALRPGAGRTRNPPSSQQTGGGPGTDRIDQVPKSTEPSFTASLSSRSVAPSNASTASSWPELGHVDSKAASAHAHAHDTRR
ncbi:P-loop containing nucleoside triphosphate hydrolase protein [Thozetella sp. PMI_491]|nr:P-loop containing nucleoside triphosphate hydrolase protein [Thozetella sp. PMI_491]